MELYLDTANIDEIKEDFDIGILTGVTTNPTILFKAGKSREESIKDILNCSNGILFVQTISEKYDDIIKEAEEY